MDASFNVAMEPFRAFVGDQLPTQQRARGYAMQSFFIGIGAVVASLLPWLLARFGVPNTAPEGAIPDTVKYAFYAGGAMLLGSVLWTVCATREYPPDALLAFDDGADTLPEGDVSRAWRIGAALGALGLLLLALILRFSLAHDLYLLAGMLIAAGLLFVWLSRTRRAGTVRQVMGDLYRMPEAMRRLAWVQFFS